MDEVYQVLAELPLSLLWCHLCPQDITRLPSPLSSGSVTAAYRGHVPADLPAQGMLSAWPVGVTLLLILCCQPLLIPCHGLGCFRVAMGSVPIGARLEGVVGGGSGSQFRVLSLCREQMRNGLMVPSHSCHSPLDRGVVSFPGTDQHTVCQLVFHSVT